MGDETMNNSMDLLDRLAARARLREPETFSVADDVLRVLRRPEPSPWAWMTVCAVTAAALMAVFAGVGGTGGDALDTMFQAANFIQTDGGF
jgi:hypothetical protein